MIDSVCCDFHQAAWNDEDLSRFLRGNPDLQQQLFQKTIELVALGFADATRFPAGPGVAPTKKREESNGSNGFLEW